MTWVDGAMLAGAAYAAALVAGVAGFGGSLIMLPVAVLFFGVREGMAILTISNTLQNILRAWVFRRDVPLGVCAWYLAGAVPANLLGAWVFTAAHPKLLARGLGAFLLATLALRRVRGMPRRRFRAPWFTPIGLAFGTLSGLVEGTGPLVAPFFLAYGLVKEAFIGTIAAVFMVTHVAKLAVFGGAGLLSGHVWAMALFLTPFMFLGVFTARYVVQRMPERLFLAVIELMLLGAGLNFLLRG